VDLGYAQYLGQGMPSCYSCDRAYDGEDSKALIGFWTGFFKEHREVLTTDVVHLLRPNGVDLDGAVHVQPDANATFRAVGHLFNPRGSVLTAADTGGALARDPATGERTLLRVPLYYAGLAAGAEVEVQLMESILSEGGKGVDAAKLAAKGLVSERSSRTLNGKAELMLPYPSDGIRPHSFLFFFVAPKQ
jgi:hypothetical protein